MSLLRSQIIILSGVLLFSNYFSVPAVHAFNRVAPCSSESADAIPQDAYFLKAEQARELQSMLDQHKVVSLEASGDYTKNGGPHFITLSSGQRLYGLPGSKVGRVIVSGGATGVVLQGLATEGVYFPSSDKITRTNCFRRINGPITVKHAKLEDNLFLDLSNASLDIDTSDSGYLRNNRFIRVMVHSAYPSLRMHGDPNRRSGNNVFLWFNVLTPHGDGIIIDNQEDVSFIGIDAESWNWEGHAKRPAMMTVNSTGTLRVLAANGGDPKSRAGRYFDIGAEEVQILGTNIGPVGDPTVTFQPEVKRICSVNMQNLSINDQSNGAFSLRAFTAGKSVALVNEVDVLLSPLTVEGKSKLHQMFSTPQRLGQPWERPVFSPIPDPAGPAWNVDLKNKPDSTSYLQHLVDSQGIAHVPAGIYYISKPIRLRAGQGIIGKGASRTAIIAKNRDIDIIVGDLHITKPSSTTFSLVDITLQGGRNGIHHAASSSGPGAQFNQIFLSHVTFRDMSEAGIFVDGIYGWDNNFIDNVNFYRCAHAGIKQRVNSLWLHGDGPGMSYMDKNVFYHCQFVQNGYGIDLQAKRANNLNAFVNCSFRDNREHAVSMTNNSSTVFANTEFANNGGYPIVANNQPTYFASCHFQANKNNVSMLPNNSTCEGCTFEMGTSTNATILAGKARAFLFNSRSVDVPAGTFDSGLLLNSALAKDPTLNQQGIFIIGGVPRVLISGSPKPIPQLLFGSNFK